MFDHSPDRSFQKISNLQITKGKWQNGLTESSHLANALITRPDQALQVLAFIGSAKYPLTATLENLKSYADDIPSVKSYGGNEGEDVNNAEYQWPLQGDIIKTVPVVGVVTPTVFPGINFSDMNVKLADRYFERGDLILTPCKNVVRVQRDPEQSGNYWIYTVALDTDNPNDYLPTEDITEGAQWAWLSNAFEEFSEGGSSKTSTPFWLRNQTQIFRQSSGMTGSAQTDVIYIKMMGFDKNGKKTERLMWSDYQSFINLAHWRRIKDNAFWHGRYNKTANDTIHLLGSNGRPVRTTAGILQQISPHNVAYYNTLTESYLRDFVNHLQLNSSEVANSEFTLWTGLGGLAMFDEALKDALQSNGVTSHDRAFVTYGLGKDGDNDFGKAGSLAYGKYFKTYTGLLGTTITVRHNPSFDDPNTHTKMGPRGLPLESYRMVFLEMGGMSDGYKNIVIKRKAGNGVNRGLLHKVTSGMSSPVGVGEMKGLLASNAIDGYQLHYLSELSICVRNPMCCGQLIMR